MLQLKNLSVQLGDFFMEDVSLDVAQGEFFLIMGPTGAGKSILLESIAGIIEKTKGGIFLKGREITSLPAEKRKISILYQDYALFPHLTVRDNIDYGVRYSKNIPSNHKEYMDSLIETLKLTTLLKRYPATLSGGEQQRTALARALAVHPDLLLLDEPLSALDPPFRAEIRSLLKSIQEKTGVTTLMVSHDLSDALSLANRMAVIHEGTIVQQGPVHEVFRRPATSFIASFTGMTNIIPVTFHETRAVTGTHSIFLTEKPEKAAGNIAIRPEDITLSFEPLDSSMRNSFKAEVKSVTTHGFYEEVLCETENMILRVHISPSSRDSLAIEKKSTIYCSFKATAVHAF
jgi:molybdate/tungstate transport system ATP-binding protein